MAAGYLPIWRKAGYLRNGWLMRRNGENHRSGGVSDSRRNGEESKYHYNAQHHAHQTWQAWNAAGGGRRQGGANGTGGGVAGRSSIGVELRQAACGSKYSVT